MGLLLISSRRDKKGIRPAITINNKLLTRVGARRRVLYSTTILYTAHKRIINIYIYILGIRLVVKRKEIKRLIKLVYIICVLNYV